MKIYQVKCPSGTTCITDNKGTSLQDKGHFPPDVMSQLIANITPCVPSKICISFTLHQQGCKWWQHYTISTPQPPYRHTGTHTLTPTYTQNFSGKKGLIMFCYFKQKFKHVLVLVLEYMAEKCTCTHIIWMYSDSYSSTKICTRPQPWSLQIIQCMNSLVFHFYPLSYLNCPVEPEIQDLSRSRGEVWRCHYQRNQFNSNSQSIFMYCDLWWFIGWFWSQYKKSFSLFW